MGKNDIIREVKDSELEPYVLKETIGVEEINEMKQQLPEITSIKQLLALSPKNDPFYMQDFKKKRAEWFAEVWKKEGKPIIHPRGLHYQILGKGYQFEIDGEMVSYQNTDQSWSYLEKGAKYARFEGLVPYEKILDEKNPEPKDVAYYDKHYEFKPFEVNYLSIWGNYINTIDDLEQYFEDQANHITRTLFEKVKYYSDSAQSNHIEIWAEKSGVIPKHIAWEFNATIRPAGGGEPSVRMCYEAIITAKEKEKDLHIFMLSDFDPKGRDMPKSVARKVEKLAKQFGITAYVHYVALTKEQCIKYSLPAVPAKEPKGTSTGMKAYTTLTNIFKEYAGQDPTELNSFQAREPEEYKKTIRDAIKPYYDKNLKEKFKEQLGYFKESIKAMLIMEFYSRILTLKEIKQQYKDGLKELEELEQENREKLDIKTFEMDLEKKKQELESFIEEKEQELGIPEIKEEIFKRTEEIKSIIDARENELDFDTLRENYKQELQLDIEDLLKDQKFNLPEAIVKDPINALLDTRRKYLEQIKKYKEFDIRHKKTGQPAIPPPEPI